MTQQLKVVEVRRVSTDDKGQEPVRQEQLNHSWAQDHAVTIVATVTDEGTSAWKKGKDNPLERPSIQQAVSLAQEKGAQGLLLETPDRFTRAGMKVLAWAEIELERLHGLKVYYADQGSPQDQAQGGFMVDVTTGMKGALAEQESAQKSRRTQEGMKQAKANGTKMGAPRKELTPEQLEIVMVKHRKGWGVRRIADHISKLRGVEKVASDEAKKKRRVGKSHIDRIIKKEKAREQLRENPPSCPSCQAQALVHLPEAPPGERWTCWGCNTFHLEDDLLELVQTCKLDKPGEGPEPSKLNTDDKGQGAGPDSSKEKVEL